MGRLDSRWRRTCRLPLGIFWAMLWLVFALPGVLLLCLAVTSTGRAAAVAWVLLLAGLHLLTRRILVNGRGAPWRWPWVLGFLVAGGSLAAVSLRNAPQTKGQGEHLRAEHIVLDEGSAYPCYDPASLVPEADLFNVGVSIHQRIDPLLTAPKAASLREIAAPIYADRAQDPVLAHLGSGLPYAERQIVGLPFDPGHYLAMLPTAKSDAPRPAIIFLHGFGGNLAAYWQVLSPLAREHGYAIICPSFGVGLWRDKASAAMVARAADDAVTRYQLDPKRLWLAGFSSGGLGVLHTMGAQPKRFRGAILISPVLDMKLINSYAKRKAWKAHPLLLIHGKEDARIPFVEVRKPWQRLRKHRARGTEMILKEEDHFLFFRQRETVVARIAAWLKKVDK